MKKYLKLIRVKHYAKNLLIFLPIIFGKKMLEIDSLGKVVLGFIVFSFTASIIYIFNDLKDIERDKNHPKKCKRPIASGEITKIQALLIILFLMVLNIILICIFLNNMKASLILAVYFVINIAYTLKLKNTPIIDITILAMGFLIRVVFGALLVHVQISNWLYLTILSISFYMAMGKRRNEIIKIHNTEDTREVLKYYNNNFLNENMYMFLGLAIMFYSLWCLDMNSQYKYIIYTIPFIMILAMKYSLNIEKDSYADPIEVIFEDKVLFLGMLIIGGITAIILYL